ncbi:MAG TPA: DMT family transporter [Parvibaculum sp.]|jgi:O-acetylserine/cysteine efflux transporter
MTRQHLAFMMLINLIWGFALVAAKVSLGHFPPMMFTAIRFILIIMVLFPFLRLHEGRMKQVLVIALCAGPLGFGFFFAGVALSNPSVVAVVSQLGVPFATILSVIFLKEQVRWKRWLGIGLSFVGVMVISFDPTVFNFLTGVIFVVISALIGSVGTIFQRQIRNVGVFEMQAWIAVIAGPMMLVCSLAFESGHWELIKTASLLQWSGICYTAFASSLIGHAGIYYLLQRYEVTQTAPLTLLSPIFTVIFSVTLLGDVVTTRMVVGALIALTGILIVSLRQKQIVDIGP